MQPVADNTPLSGYGAALTAAIYAMHQMEEGAVKVVRCKECKHYEITCYEYMCNRWEDWLPTEDDDFCSYGERRSDNG